MMKLLTCIITVLLMLTCQMSETRRTCIPQSKVCGEGGRVRCCEPLKCTPVVSVDNSQVTSLQLCLPSADGAGSVAGADNNLGDSPGVGADNSVTDDISSAEDINSKK